MKNAIKQICFLLYAISLITILADSSFIVNAFSQNHVDCENACSDFSDDRENTHSICFEDVLYLNDTHVKSSDSNYKTLLHRASNFNFLNTFSTTIWQPPKRA